MTKLFAGPSYVGFSKRSLQVRTNINWGFHRYTLKQGHKISRARSRSDLLNRVTKGKKETWKVEEIDFLLEKLDKRMSILLGKQSTFLSNEKKNAQWQAVATAVNAVSNTESMPSLDSHSFFQTIIINCQSFVPWYG